MSAWRRTTALLFLAILLGGVQARAGTFLESETLTHEGATRWYDLYVPDGLGDAPVPLLVVLHGGTLSNDSLRVGAGLRLRTLADSERFVVALPNGTSSDDGTSGPSGSFNWNDCRSDGGPATTNANDSGFIATLIDAISATLPIDAERVYVVGASNGGMMAYRLGLELSDRIAAIAVAVANQPVNSECVDAPAEPLSVLIMNGTADVIMPWAGGQVGGNRGLVMSAEDTRDFWRERLGTNAVAQHTDYPDLDPNDSGTVSSDRYTGGREGSEVLFYTVAGGKHDAPSIAYPGSGGNHDVEAIDEFWRFLSVQRRSGGTRRASGIQVTPDGLRILVSKDAGNERWAITYEPASGALTGNVFRTDGAPPTFLACSRSSEPDGATLAFGCSAADACPAAPCDPGRWTDLGSVELPASFFTPPLER